METVTQTTNQKFYKRMIANLYYPEYKECGSSVFRASNFEEAAAKIVSKDPDYELIGLHKLDISDNNIQDLYETMGAIEMLITFEDEHDLYSGIYHSKGDYQFTLDQLSEDYIRQLNSMRLLIEKLQSIEKEWDLRHSAVELFQEENKKRREDSQAA